MVRYSFERGPKGGLLVKRNEVRLGSVYSFQDGFKFAPGWLAEHSRKALPTERDALRSRLKAPVLEAYDAWVGSSTASEAS